MDVSRSATAEAAAFRNVRIIIGLGGRDLRPGFEERAEDDRAVEKLRYVRDFALPCLVSS
jgi:hypothetical protein